MTVTRALLFSVKMRDFVFTWAASSIVTCTVHLNRPLIAAAIPVVSVFFTHDGRPRMQREIWSSIIKSGMSTGGEDIGTARLACLLGLNARGICKWMIS